MEVLEFYRDLTEYAGFELENRRCAQGVVVNSGYWLMHRQRTVLKGTDVINGYVLLATSCDGSLATVRDAHHGTCGV